MVAEERAKRVPGSVSRGGMRPYCVVDVRLRCSVAGSRDKVRSATSSCNISLVVRKGC